MKLVHKNEIYHQVFDAFAKCLIRPENPFTLDNPDLLVNENNRMYALYIPTYEERNNYDQLLRRLFLSQLCYSQKLISILLINPEDKVSGNGEYLFQKSFCHVARSVNDVIDYIRTGERVDRRWDLMRRNQQLCFSDFHICSKATTAIKRSISNVYADFSEELLERSQPISTWKSLYRRSYRVYQGYSTDFGNVIFKEKGRLGIKESFNQVLTSRFMESFLFDDGYIYANNNRCSFSLINTDWELFENELYPGSMARMLNFVGYSVAQINDVQSLERAFKKYKEIKNHE